MSSANHTYGHRFSHYLDQPSMRHEIDRAQQILTAEIGAAPALFRPPWLHRQPLLLATVRSAGMQVVSGQFAHPMEVMQPAAQRIARHALSITRPGTILILHDGYNARGGYRGQTVAATGQLIDGLRTAGFQFQTVDELLGVAAYQAPVGIGSRV